MNVATCVGSRPTLAGTDDSSSYSITSSSALPAVHTFLKSIVPSKFRKVNIPEFLESDYNDFEN